MRHLDAETLKKSLTGGWRYLELNSRVLDNLNVFPVPDGDTGINMVSTLRSGIQKATDPSVSSIAEVSRHLTGSFSENSRGNSGFIISQFFAGFFEMVGELDAIDAANLVGGFSNGSYHARTSLLTPVEGTMITIMSAMVEELEQNLTENVIECFDHALSAARRKIHETPSILPVLARAGVVDSGGLGFLFFVEGMLRGLTENDPVTETEDDYRFDPDPNVVIPEPEDHQFCTEYTVELNPAVDSAKVSEFRETLPGRGSSIALVQTDVELRLHIHTNEPEVIGDQMSGLGRVVRCKVEDMHDQMAAIRTSGELHEETAILAIVPGDGFETIFQDLGAAATMTYGATLPSAGEIASQVNQLETAGVIILTNDKNIVPAAMLASQESAKSVTVLPTANVVQGLSTMYAFLDSESVQTNLIAMNETLNDGLFARLYVSTKDTVYGGTSIRKGDFFVISGDEVLGTGSDPAGAVAAYVGVTDLSAKGSITFFYGTDDGERIAGLATEVLQESVQLELETVYGGQTGSLLIIAIE